MVSPSGATPPSNEVDLSADELRARYAAGGSIPDEALAGVQLRRRHGVPEPTPPAPPAMESAQTLLKSIGRLPKALGTLDFTSLKEARCNICTATARLAKAALNKSAETFMKNTSSATRRKIGASMMKTGNAAKLLTAVPALFGAHVIDQSGRGNSVMGFSPLGYTKSMLVAAASGAAAICFYKACNKFIEAGKALRTDYIDEDKAIQARNREPRTQYDY